VLPVALTRLVQLFSRLPGVGEKTAQRFVLELLGRRELGQELGRELSELANRVRPCERCGGLAEVDEHRAAVCGICRDNRREATLLCVVSRVQDLMAIERSGAMRGRYFVLGRLLSPLDGIGPDQLPLEALYRRVREDAVTEVIVATPPSVDGEATALLIARDMANLGARVTRIASGIPHGGELEVLDQITLGRAIDGRRTMGEGG
jgi:recombination protein RecR